MIWKESSQVSVFDNTTSFVYLLIPHSYRDVTLSTTRPSFLSRPLSFINILQLLKPLLKHLYWACLLLNTSLQHSDSFVSTAPLQQGIGMCTVVEGKFGPNVIGLHVLVYSHWVFANVSLFVQSMGNGWSNIATHRLGSTE